MKMRYMLGLSASFTTPSSKRFSTSIHDVELGSLKSFYQISHMLISVVALKKTNALPYYKKIGKFDSSLMLLPIH